MQPVIHREIVRTEVRHITQPVYEEITRDVQIHEGELSEEVREKIESGAKTPESYVLKQ